GDSTSVHSSKVFQNIGFWSCNSFTSGSTNIIKIFLNGTVIGQESTSVTIPDKIEQPIYVFSLDRNNTSIVGSRSRIALCGIKYKLTDYEEYLLYYFTNQFLVSIGYNIVYDEDANFYFDRVELTAGSDFNLTSINPL